MERSKLAELFHSAGRDDFAPIEADRAEERQVQSRSWTWGALNSGDCIMEAGSRLTIYDDGVAKFEATTYTNSTHSGDVWHHLMYVTDDRDQLLFWVGFFDGPRMNDGNPPPKYNWVKTSRFKPELYAKAAKAYVRAYEC